MKYIAYIDKVGILKRVKIKDDPNLRSKVTFVQQLADRGQAWIIGGTISSEEIKTMFNHPSANVSVYEAYEEPRDPSEPHIGSATTNYTSSAGEKSDVQLPDRLSLTLSSKKPNGD